MNKWFVLASLLTILAGCKYVEPIDEVNVQHDSQYSLVDSTAKTDSFKVYAANDRSAWYPIYYYGDTKNTYTLGKYPITERLRQQKLDSTLHTARWTDNHLSIFVDTALDIARKEIYSHQVINPERKRDDPVVYVTDSVKHLKVYPVFITNICDSTLYLGYHNYLNFVVREAKNKQGKWIPIETYTRSFECFNCRVLFLAPHQIMIVKLSRYHGNFKTTCRLRFGNKRMAVYSNTFTEFIDERMLNPITEN